MRSRCRKWWTMPKKSPKVSKSEGIYGFALNFKNPKQAFDRSIREILSLSGYQGLGYDLKTYQFDFAPYAQVIEYFKQMYKDGSILPGAESLDIDPLRAQFAAGKIRMYLSFSTEPGVYKDQFPTEINWAGALAPTLDGQIKGTSEIVSMRHMARDQRQIRPSGSGLEVHAIHVRRRHSEDLSRERLRHRCSSKHCREGAKSGH